jgi:hypothetical protein
VHERFERVDRSIGAERLASTRLRPPRRLGPADQDGAEETSLFERSSQSPAKEAENCRQ